MYFLSRDRFSSFVHPQVRFACLDIATIPTFVAALQGCSPTPSSSTVQGYYISHSRGTAFTHADPFYIIARRDCIIVGSV